jgi:hypothetical protein
VMVNLTCMMIPLLLKSCLTLHLYLNGRPRPRQPLFPKNQETGLARSQIASAAAPPQVVQAISWLLFRWRMT